MVDKSLPYLSRLERRSESPVRRVAFIHNRGDTDIQHGSFQQTQLSNLAMVPRAAQDLVFQSQDLGLRARALPAEVPDRLKRRGVFSKLIN